MERPRPFGPDGEMRFAAGSGEALVSRAWMARFCLVDKGDKTSIEGDGLLRRKSWKLVARRRSGTDDGNLCVEDDSNGVDEKVGAAVMSTFGDWGGSVLEVSVCKPSFGDPVAEMGEAGLTILSAKAGGGLMSPARYSGVGGLLLSVRGGNALTSVELLSP